MTRAALLWLTCCAGLAAAPGAGAEALAFFDRGRAAATPLVALAEPGRRGGAAGSLFSGRTDGGLFAPWSERGDVVAAVAPWTGGGSDALRIRDLIARAEAGQAGYDAVQHGARLRPPRPPTQMRVQDIYDWIRATPGQPHAIGRYQFIPSTLRRLMRDLGVDPAARFSPDLQDRLADRLLSEAGLHAVRDGTLGRRDFMVNLAGIWAGFPLPSGRSRYHGHAGNRATMSWPAFEAEMVAIFPR
ncbi:hypothetical protein [Roseivivax isoporae]|uniref:Uncharacterized protein n=1 Tax=Roseivivax isoporae LMG 25204 TaxID=1449351 RepID=X7FDC5_9RHOB|nr:hypothetical protein [Roseivivax isoporae]ETX30922.1 hypothetical protein RISW2_00660 [Roseivivax isoporae LMG 25204]